jgi:hypothetical protein
MISRPRRAPAPRAVPRAVATGLAALLCGGAPAAAAADDPPLNLFQRIARAELVVHAKVREGALKYALVEVIESLKGEPPQPRLRIAFRDYNFDRPPGAEPIVFTDGQEELLFLAPYGRVKRRPKNRDLYEILRGPEGRITVPPEGPERLLGAIRRLAGITRLDPASQADALRALLGADNPDLVAAALDEVMRLRALTPDLYPRLTALARGVAPGLREAALRAIGRLFAGAAGRGSAPAGGRGAAGSAPVRELDEARAALAAALERARGDDLETVRVEAVAALGAWPERAEVEGELRAIADQDPAQAVRYEAERALFRLRPSP